MDNCGGWIFIILIICPRSCPHNSHEQRDNSYKVRKRLLDMMWNYVARMRQKIEDINYIRGRHETSPHFELGYVMSEVLERYRKMVGIIKRPMAFKSDAVYDTLKRTEMVQHLFLDILHLIYMVNELRRKYLSLPQFTAGGGEDYNITTDDLVENQKVQMWLLKKKQKENKKIRNMIVRGEMKFTTGTTKKKGSKWWPIDYGWEIDYRWW